MVADVTRIAFAQREYRTAPAVEDTTIFTAHPLAQELEYNTLLSLEADATAFGNYVLGLRKLDRWTWACYVNKTAYSTTEIGDTITIVYPRFGFEDGANFIVKRIKKDSNSLFDEYTLFGPEQPAENIFASYKLALSFKTDQYWRDGLRYGSSNGPELNANPDFNGSTGYTLTGAASVTGGQGVIPKSNSAANGIVFSFPVSGVQGKRYRATINVVANTIVDGDFRMGAGQSGNYLQDGVVFIGSGQTGQMSVDFTVSHVNVPSITLVTVDGTNVGSIMVDSLSIVELPGVWMVPGYGYTRSGIQGAVNSAGAVQFFAANTPAINDQGYHAYSAVTNGLLRSQEFGNAAWTNINTTVTSDFAVAPDGTTTMDKLTSASAGQSGIYQSVTVSSGVKCSASFFFNPQTSTAPHVYIQINSGANIVLVSVNRTSGVVNSEAVLSGSSIGAVGYLTQISASLWRFTVVYTSSTTTSLVVIGQADSNGSQFASSGITLIAWQFQHLQGQFRDGGPIITTTAATASLGASPLYITNPVTVDQDFIWWAIVNFKNPTNGFEYDYFAEAGLWSLSRHPAAVLLSHVGGVQQATGPSIGAQRGVVLVRRKSGKTTLGYKVDSTVTMTAETGVTSPGNPGSPITLGYGVASAKRIDSPLEGVFMRLGSFSDLEISNILGSA